MLAQLIALSLPFVLSGLTAAQVTGVRVRSVPETPASFVAPRLLEDPQPGVLGGMRAAGDLDGDGDVDALRLRRAPNSAWNVEVQSWLNHGELGFAVRHVTSFQLPGTTFGTFSVASNVQLADVTGDGILDLLYDRFDPAALVGPSGLLVRPGNGDGSFGPRHLLQEGGTLFWFGVGDRDGDGTNELVLGALDGASSERLRWWSFDGAAFVPGPALTTTGLVLSRGVVADFDADGADDVALIGNASQGLVRLFPTRAGTPTIGPIVALPPEIQGVTRLNAGDLEGDGDDDLFLVRFDTAPDPAAFLVLAQEAGGLVPGAVQLVENASFDWTVTSNPALADWDGDGDLDVLTSAMSFWENDGDNAFLLTAKAANVLLSADDPAFVADFDGDGALDLAGGWALFQGDGSLPRSVSQPRRDDLSGLGGGDVRDYEGDGDLDFVRPDRLTLNHGDGNFDLHVRNVPSEGLVRVPVGAGDFDGDGLDDLVAALFAAGPGPFDPPTFERMALYTGTDSGDYVVSATVPNSVEMAAPSSSADLSWWSADVDDDGDEDLVVLNGWWSNQGAGVFDPLLLAGFDGLPLATSDADQDGDADLLVAHGGELRSLRNEGGGLLVPQVLGAHASGSRARFVDLEGDGDLDVASWREGFDGLALYELAFGSYAPALTLDLPTAAGIDVAAVDVDGDGLLDLLAHRTSSLLHLEVALLSVWSGSTELDYGTRKDYVVRAGGGSFGDFDADGDVDVFGIWAVENLRFDGEADGVLEQYRIGAGVPGSGGLRPVLGASGPVRVGSTSVALHARRALGGTSGWLLTGAGRGFQPSVAFPGVTSFVDPLLSTSVISFGGAPGAAGRGTTDLALLLPPSLVGQSLTFQVYAVDPGSAVGIATSNGLELTIGEAARSHDFKAAGTLLR